MASKHVAPSPTGYTKLDTGSASAILIQNVGGTDIRVIFASSTPAATATGWFLLTPGQAIARDSMTNDAYAMAVTSELARVAVGE